MNVIDELMKEREKAAAKLAEIEREIEALQPSGPVVVDGPTFAAEKHEFAWLVGGLIARDTISMLVADPGIGKSTLMAQLTISLSAGRTFLGGHVPRPVRTLMIQGEGARSAFQARYLACCRTLAITPKKSWFIQVHGPSEYQIGDSRLTKAITQAGAELVILDTMAFFATFDENDANSFREKVMKPLRTLVADTHASVILVHHQPKITEANRNAREGRGTSAMLADVDHFWKLDTVEGEPDKRVFVIRKNKYGLEVNLPLRFDSLHAVFTAPDGELLDPIPGPADLSQL